MTGATSQAAGPGPGSRDIAPVICQVSELRALCLMYLTCAEDYLGGGPAASKTA
jgi:hypothetical protein